MIDTIKRRIITALTIITLLAVSFTSIGCSDSCNPTTAEIDNLKPMVSGITVGYEDGATIELTPDSAHFNDVCDEALRIALSINIHYSGLQTVEQLYEAHRKFVYVSFAQPVEITTCIIVPEEERDHITTNEDGYRIITPTELVILPQGTTPEICLPEIWACAENVCGMWDSARAMDTINDLIDDLR
ncbi:MAG: hypothetical protein WC562_06385 [Dehalococcoidia bacterium]